MINISQERDFLKISYYNKDGDIEMKNIELNKDNKFEWRPSKRYSELKSWTGENVSKRYSNYLSKWRQIEILENQLDKDFYQNNLPKKFFMDIETMVDGEFPDPKDAKKEVTSISFVHDNQVSVMGTKTLSHKEIKGIEKDLNDYVTKYGYDPYEFTFLYYKTESSMLLDLFENQIPKMPLITGWNFVGFDWLYLINRAKRLNIDTTTASPIGEMFGQFSLPTHRTIVDYLDVFKKWDYSVFKENLTLEYISKTVNRFGKIKFNGSFDDLYNNNYHKHILYNAVDSILVQLIDRNIGTMDIFFHLADITKTPLSRVMSPIALTENVYVRELLGRGVVIPYEKKEVKREKYEGAFVFKPQVGFHEWVASFDYASLYPSIMRQWNISPENYIGVNLDFIPKVKHTKTVNKAFFKDDIDSAFRVILTNYYGKRKEAKSKMKDIKHDLGILKKMLKEYV